jgi:hypothetical protein
MACNSVFRLFVAVAAIATSQSVLSPALVGQAPAQQAQTAPLTNGDVIRMVRARLGDGVIVARIRTSPNRFDTTVDSLIALRQAGVSNAVMEAMTEAGSRTAPTPVSSHPMSASPAAPPPAASDPNNPDAPHEAGIYVLRNGPGGPRMIMLEPTAYAQARASRGLLSSVTLGVVQSQLKVVVAQDHATIRLTEQRPTFYFYFEQRSSAPDQARPWAAYFAGASSANEFTLARFEVGHNKRELVVGEQGAFFRSSSGTRERDVVPFDFERVSPGSYRVTPRADLAPGEYCFFYTGTNMAYGAGGGKLFDFGVDRVQGASPER